MPDLALIAASRELMTLDDDEAAPTWPNANEPMIIDLAAKIISYYTAGDDDGRVQLQYLQTSCGCAGSSQGIKQDFTYYDLDGDQSADETQTTTFSYKFSSGDAIAWIHTAVEAELEEENGPEGTYDSYDVYGSRGELEWTRNADNTLDRTEYDTTTRALTASAA